ncbi:TIGR04222 domain-containing protein [Geodermatophilus telluris]|uniref:TIGR04222 domain-containing protein n=2 Tax=Geodermatophilus telluris TaxID=1190417 RepID=A0A1G6ISF7_9ACTN|nr:TIGR04222 domain-containing protein [Geodermatophilus telluris]
MTPQPDVYDVACLAGGTQRVVDTALVALVVTGRVRAVAPGELQVADPRRRHPVEAAVLDAVGARGRRSVETVRWRALGDDRVTAVARRLRREGLLGRLLGPTAAGRRLLRGARPGAGDPVRPVALDGPHRLEDPALRAAVLEPPPRPVLPGAATPWELTFADNCEVARRTREELVSRAQHGRG